MENGKTPLLIISGSVRFFASASGIPEIRERFAAEHASTLNDAKIKLLTSDFPVVVVNAPLEDGFGLDLAAALVRSRPCAVMIIAGENVFPALKQKTDPLGIVAIRRPFSVNTFTQTVLMLENYAGKMKKVFESKGDLTGSEREEMKLLNRAKLILMQRFSMTENEAHQYVQKRAMDMKETKRSVAEKIIKAYEN